MFSTDRNQIRAFFREAWRKHRAGTPVTPMESIVIDVVAAHPEYHSLLEDPAADLQQDYAPEAGGTNPFLHMGLHIALREQLGADRPRELRPVYQQLLSRTGDAHAAEHQVIECIAEVLARAQRDGNPADDRHYLDCLRRLL